MAEGVLNDPQMRQFVQTESSRMRFQKLVHTLTEQCWDRCMGTPGQTMDKKTHKCMTNCVERFIDTSEFVVKRLEKEGEQHMAGMTSDQGSTGGSGTGDSSGSSYKWF